MNKITSQFLCIVLLLDLASVGTGSEIEFPDLSGWMRSDTPDHYTEQTLYDYINGAADLYLRYDFKELDVMNYENTGGAFSTIDMYELMYLEPLEGLEDSRERLAELLAMMFDDEYMDRQFLLVFVAMLYRASRSEKVRQAIAGMFERFVRELEGLLIEAAGPGGIEGKHAHDIAVQIVALQDGITEHWLLGTDAARPSMALEMVNCILEKNIGINIDGAD